MTSTEVLLDGERSYLGEVVNPIHRSEDPRLAAHLLYRDTVS